MSSYPSFDIHIIIVKINGGIFSLHPSRDTIVEWVHIDFLLYFQHMVQTGMTTPYTAFAQQNGAGGPDHGPSPLKQAQQAALNDMKGPPSLVDNCHAPTAGNGGGAPPPPNGVTVASIQAAQVAAVQQAAAAQAQAAAVAAAAQQQVAAAQAAAANGVEAKGKFSYLQILNC